MITIEKTEEQYVVKDDKGRVIAAFALFAERYVKLFKLVCQLEQICRKLLDKWDSTKQGKPYPPLLAELSACLDGLTTLTAPLNKTTPTLEQVKDAALLVGLSDEQAEQFFHHYNKQGWVLGNGQKITNLHSALNNWKIAKNGTERKSYEAAKSTDTVIKTTHTV